MRGNFQAAQTRRWLVGLLAAMALAGPPANSQTVIGYTSFTPQPDSRALTSDTAFYIPFAFLLTDPYQLGSVSLLLSGNASLSDFSLLVTPTLGTDLSLPTPVTATFSATGLLMNSPAAITFQADSLPVLSPSTTYYLRLAYTGSATANWVANSVASGSGGSASTGGGPNTSGGGDPGSGGAPGGGTLYAKFRPESW